MFSTLAIAAAAVLVFASNALAQNPYTNQSEPFDLVVRSNNATLNGSYLFPCHEGAAIEALCVLRGQEPTNSTFYHLNTTSYSIGETPDYGTVGVIAWGLPYTGANNTKGIESEPLNLLVNYSSNVAFTQFAPTAFQADNLFVSFDNSSKLNIQGADNWWVCLSNYLGYRYETLSYVIGTPGSEPDTPEYTCQKVGVYQQFV